MITKIYAIYDNKAEAFMQPFFAATPGLALRTFEDNANNPDSILSKHPNDFCLYEIGVFDDQTAEIINHSENINLGMATEYSPKLEAVQ